MKTKRSTLRNSVVENNNEKTAVYSQNSSITDIMATDDGKFQYSTDGGQSFEEVSTQVDATLSTTSENPVQNKVITENINNIINNVTKIENSSGGGSVGALSNTDTGGAVGHGAIAISGGGAVGSGANTQNGGGAVGASASCSGSGGAIGFDARTSNGFAGGMMAKTVNSNNSGIDAIQLGTGTNSTEKTLQIYNDNIYNANTHTLTVENAQIDGNITDGTNTVTVADIATKVKFITLTSTTNTHLTDEQKGILLEDENNYIVAGGRVFRYSNNLSTADNVKFYTFVGNGATTEDKIIQTCSFFSGNTPALLSFNSEVNINNLATKNDIQTNNNQLENGAGYITSPEFIATSYDLINPVSSKIVDNSVSSGPKNKWIFNKMFYEVSTSDVQSSIQTIYNFLNSLNLETDKVYNCLVGNDVGILLKSTLPGVSKYSYQITAFGKRNCYFYVADTAATTRFALHCFFSTDVYNTLFLNGIWK